MSITSINLTSPNFAAIATGISVCVIEALNLTPALAPTRQCLLVPTQQIAHDNCDCGGQVASAIQQVWGSDTFPQVHSGTWVKCGPRWTVAQIIVSVTRCVPTIDEVGNPPDCDDVLAAAITLENDRAASRQAIACCLQQLYEASATPAGGIQYWVGPSVTVGELGGCAGVETVYQVGVRSGCPCAS